MNITSDLIDSRYRIIRNIGNGSMGSVFLVHDEKLDKLWAAKLVKNITSNELLALKSVCHPSFPRLVDTIKENDYIWLIMDYIEGMTLQQFVASARCGRNTLYSIALQLAKAIEYLHSLTPAMLYLDCKPDNILVDNNGMLHLIDLGSIYLINMSNPGRISGTAGYAPLEQRLGHHVDVRSDIYSYGMTLRAISPGPETPDIIVSIIKRCIKSSPSRRFQTMHEITECLINRSNIKKITLCKALSLTYIILVTFTFTLFTIISIYTYSTTTNVLYILLASVLFRSLLLILDKNRHNMLFSRWVCKKDIYLSRGLKTLPIILCVIAASLLSYASANATNLHAATYNSNDYRITLYTAKDEKILYRGQKFTVNSDGSITLSIPISSLTSDSIPAKLEITPKSE